MKKLSPTATGVLLAATALSAPAAAQTVRADATAGTGSDARRIAALEARVAELEKDRETPLTFGDAATGTEVEFYGYLKSDFIYDFDYKLGNTTFGLVGIGPDGADGDAFTATVNQTRLGFRTRTETGFGELGTQVEIDFYGASGAFADAGPEPRLRHANATLGGLRVGKYWTTFMPLSSYPVTLDFQGVAGIPFARQEMIQYTHDFGDALSASVALEDSNAGSDTPVLIGALAYDTDPLLLRGSVIGGRVEEGGTGDDVDVWGVNVSTTAKLWQGATLDAAYTQGEGIASYLVFLGDDLDASGDPIEVRSAYAGLTQSVGEDWTFRAIYGWRENESGMTGGTESLQSVHLNAEYALTERASFGVEYFHGRRDTFGGGEFDTNRIQTSMQVDF